MMSVILFLLAGYGSLALFRDIREIVRLSAEAQALRRIRDER